MYLSRVILINFFPNDPVPPVIRIDLFLSILLTVNIALAVTILLVAVYTKEPLQYSTFPTILLISTLFRLGLNVSTTRLILLYGYAGDVITAFGSFVVGGNYVVGVLIFIILVIINFIVITNGAGRVSEVLLAYISYRFDFVLLLSDPFWKPGSRNNKTMFQY